MKSKTLLFGLTFALLTAGGAAQAASTLKSYNEDVGAFNGSAYTDSQTMYEEFGAEKAKVNSQNVSGDYTVDVRINTTSPKSRNSSWKRNLGDTQTFTFTSEYHASSETKQRVQFSNDLTTPKTVNVKGTWTNY
ncbi:hypothetical protein ACFRH9_28660 [Peribacillus butanolivorans]|uniref:hypothetical protein n=1 Tax=Peribacillus butanolivorans TaxID=421767 RepID=UPI00366AEC83